MMKFEFKYCGQYKGNEYFTIITDDGRGVNLQGVDICYNHYKFSPASNTIEKVNYHEMSLLNTTVHHVDGTITKAIMDTITPEQEKEFAAKMLGLLFIENGLL